MGSQWNAHSPLLPNYGWRGWLIRLVSLYGFLTQVAAKHECFADPNGPKDDPNNIYKCENNEKCCQEGGNPSCCREKEQSVAVWEQIQLWGTLAVMILILGFVMWYCRHDGDCCGNKKGEDSSCCKCCGNKKNEDEIIQVHRDDDSDSDDDDTRRPHGKTRDDPNDPPGPAVYTLPDAKHHPPPRRDDIPEAYRDMDVEIAH